MKNRFYVGGIWKNRLIMYFEFLFIFFFMWDVESFLSTLGGVDMLISNLFCVTHLKKVVKD